MELLLLLTALFASLTGASGDRSAGPLQGVAVVRAAQAAQVAVSPARRAIPPAVLPSSPRAPRVLVARLPDAPVAALRLAFERRLE